ncbi:hypothetical protein BBJ28_00006291 [Nothophytophthora sp. Chile5]|nr:hypothetical protein BBJ28_00006291 [Nothophytophthora sp. Chile5]
MTPATAPLYAFLLLSSLFASLCHGAAYPGLLTFYEGKHFIGRNMTYDMANYDCQDCNVLQEHDQDVASSMKWKGFPKAGGFGDDKKSMLAFYSDVWCNQRLGTWFTTEKNFPADLARDDMDNKIKAVYRRRPALSSMRLRPLYWQDALLPSPDARATEQAFYTLMPPPASFLVLLVTVTLLVSSRPVNAGAGSVTFFMGANFKREDGYYKFKGCLPQECYNLPDIFNNCATSVKWQGFVQHGAFDGHAMVALYNGPSCSGKVLTKPTTEQNYPANLALDGIDDQLSSFMIWETSKDAREGISRKSLR